MITQFPESLDRRVSDLSLEELSSFFGQLPVQELSDLRGRRVAELSLEEVSGRFRRRTLAVLPRRVAEALGIRYDELEEWAEENRKAAANQE